MGRIFVVDLEGRIYKCKFCQTHLALADDLVSRGFHCRRGKAYLFNKVVNVTVGPQEERAMLSGMHTVADIFCCCCGQIVGWKYEEEIVTVGLEYHSSTVGRLFKSGFGRFGLGQAKPSLADHDVILVFVVGGINGVEVREAQEALSESNRPEVELILGGTTFLTPKDMFELLLGDYCCV